MSVIQGAGSVLVPKVTLPAVPKVTVTYKAPASAKATTTVAPKSAYVAPVQTSLQAINKMPTYNYSGNLGPVAPAPVQTSLQAINQLTYNPPSEPKTTALYQPPPTLSQTNLSPGGAINAPVAPAPTTMNSTNLSPWGTINNPTAPVESWLGVAGAGGLNAPINNPANPLSTPGIAGGGGYGPGNALNPLMLPSTTLSPWGLINGPPTYTTPTTTSTITLGNGTTTTTDNTTTGGGGGGGGGYGSGGGGNYYGSASGLINWRIGT